MKKALIVISSMLVVAGVFSSQSFAHGGHHRFGHHGGKHGNVWVATLTPPGATGETGQTGAAASSFAKKAHHKKLRRAGKARISHYWKGAWNGATAPAGASQTGPGGKAIYTQTRGKYFVAVKVKNLTPSTAYSVALYKDTDGTGPASTTNPALNPPAIPDFTTDASGDGLTGALGKKSIFSLDPTAGYYLKVTDSTGATVLAGALVTFGRGHKGCGGHGATGTTGATDSDPRPEYRH